MSTPSLWIVDLRSEPWAFTRHLIPILATFRQGSYSGFLVPLPASLSFGLTWLHNWQWDTSWGLRPKECPLKPCFYLRFLDNIIGTWQNGEENFKKSIGILNNRHPSIKVKYSPDPSEVNFLYTTVFFENINNNNDRLLTQIYFEPWDTHALLH